MTSSTCVLLNSTTSLSNCSSSGGGGQADSFLDVPRVIAGIAAISICICWVFICLFKTILFIMAMVVLVKSHKKRRRGSDVSLTSQDPVLADSLWSDFFRLIDYLCILEQLHDRLLSLKVNAWEITRLAKTMVNIEYITMFAWWVVSKKRFWL